MKVLDRYVTREFLKTFLFGVIALILVSVVVDIFERVDDIVKYKPPFSTIITYFLSKIPETLLLTTPISILLATLLVTGAFSRNSEIIAMLASGISIYRIMVPLLIVGFIISLLMFGLNELIVPTTNRLVDETMRIIKGRPEQSKMAKIQIWFRGKREAPHLYENRIYYLNALIPERFDPNQGVMLPPEIQGLTVFELNPDQFVPVRRLDVQRAVYNSPQPPVQEKGTLDQRSRLGKIADFFYSLFLKIVAVFHVSEEQEAPLTMQLGTWTLYDGTVRTLADQARRTITTFQVRHDYSIPRTFEEFRRDTKDPEDMNYRELRQYIEALTASGYDISKYIVDLRAKFSYPFASFVMIIIGFPFALKSPRSGAAMGVGLSVFIGFSYWIIMQLGISLGHANIFPPTLAVWIAHILFISAGFYLILSTRT